MPSHSAIARRLILAWEVDEAVNRQNEDEAAAERQNAGDEAEAKVQH